MGLSQGAMGMMLALSVALPVAAGTSDLEAELRQVSLTLKDANSGSKMFLGADRWVLLTSELDWIVTPRFWGGDAAAANRRCSPELADPVPAIVDFHQQLKALGIQLYLVPVPIRELLYPESVLGTQRIPPTGPQRLHPLQDEFYEVLRSEGVRVVDLLALFLEHRDDERPLYHRSDPHWSSWGVVLAATELTRLISGGSWYSEVQRQQMVAEWLTEEHVGPLYREFDDPDGILTGPEIVQVRRITHESGKRIGLRNPDSPVVLIGDSNASWWKKHQAALPHQLAFALGFPVDLLSSAGGGATETRLNLVRTAHADPSYLVDKKVVIWCFTTRVLIKAKDGWAKLPLPQPVETDPSDPQDPPATANAPE